MIKAAQVFLLDVIGVSLFLSTASHTPPATTLDRPGIRTVVLAAQFSGNGIAYSGGEFIDTQQSDEFVTVVKRPGGSVQIFYHDANAGNKLVKRDVLSGQHLRIAYWDCNGQLIHKDVTTGPSAVAKEGSRSAVVPGVVAPPSSLRVPPVCSASSPSDYVSDMEHAAYWNRDRMPLKVYFHKCNEVRFFDESFVECFRGACENWSRATANRIQFQFTENLSEADIDVRWTEDKTSWGMEGHENALGVTAVSTGGCCVVHAQVFILTGAHQRKFSTRLMRHVCLHELGHALGIWHSPNTADIMAPSVPTVPAGNECDTPLSEMSPKLSARDEGTVRSVYAARGEIDDIEAKGLDKQNTCVDLNNASANMISANQQSKAILVLRRLLELDPTCKTAQANLAVCYYNSAVERYNKKLYSQAVPLFQKSLVLVGPIGKSFAPSAAEISKMLAQCNRQLEHQVGG